MEKDIKPQPGGDKPSDKKATPQPGGNIVWYLLGLGVLLLLMVTIFQSGSQQRVGWSDLLRLVEASGKDGTGSIEINDTSSNDTKRYLLSDLSDINVGSSYVT